MNPWAFAALCLVVVVGSLLQVAIGFGLGLLAAPVLALLAPELLPVVLLVLAMGITLVTVIRERHSVDLRGFGWALVGRVPGTAAGALLVALLPMSALSLFVALVVVVGVAVTAWGYSPRPSPAAVAAAGLASGVMATTTSIGGPPMAMVWSRFAGARLRGTMSGFFLVGSLMSFAALTAVGSVTSEALRWAVFLAPAAVLGVLLAGPVGRRLDVRLTRVVAMAVALVGAGVVVVQQVF